MMLMAGLNFQEFLYQFTFPLVVRSLFPYTLDGQIFLEKQHKTESKLKGET